MCWLIAVACGTSSRDEAAFESVRTARLVGTGSSAVQMFGAPEGPVAVRGANIRGRCCIPEGSAPATLRAMILPADAGGLPARRRPAARLRSTEHPGRCVDAHDTLECDARRCVVEHDLHCELVDAEGAGPVEIEMMASIVGEDGERRLAAVGAPVVRRDRHGDAPQ